VPGLLAPRFIFLEAPVRVKQLLRDCDARV
jgi:hypothetical protein